MFLSKGRFGIKVIPLNKIPLDILRYLEMILQENFRKKVFRTERMAVPPKAWNAERSQYKTDEILNFLIGQRVHKENVVGITYEDIYKDEEPFVFGDATPPGHAAVVSLWRFDQNLKHFDCDPDLFWARLRKELLLQTARTFGLRHCQNQKCVMHFSQTMGQIDVKEDQFCENCAAQI